MQDIFNSVLPFQKPIVLKLANFCEVSKHLELHGQMRTFDAEKDIKMICVTEREMRDKLYIYAAVHIHHASSETWTWTIENYENRWIKVDIMDNSSVVYFSGIFEDYPSYIQQPFLCYLSFNKSRAFRTK